MKISAVIIAFNEEENIAEAIKSVAWADEILVVDSASTDQTAEIAQTLNAKVLVKNGRVFQNKNNLPSIALRTIGYLALTRTNEFLKKLRDEILQIKNQTESISADGYKIPRLTFYMNRWIRHGGWHPDWQLRFFNRRKGKWKEVLIHESVRMKENARVERLSGKILHYSIPDARYHNRMIADRYAPLAAEQMFERGRKTSPIKIFTAGSTAFLQTYILKLGFLDGLAGFCIARFAAHHAFLKHLLLWELQKNRKAKAQSRKSKIAD